MSVKPSNTHKGMSASINCYSSAERAGLNVYDINTKKVALMALISNLDQFPRLVTSINDLDRRPQIVASIKSIAPPQTLANKPSQTELRL